MDLFIDILGYFAAFGVAVVSLPLLIRVIKTKNTTTINLSMMSLIIVSSILFLITGIYSGVKTQFNGLNIAVIVSNSCAGINASIVSSFKIINLIQCKKMKISEEELIKQKIIKKENNC